MGEASGALDDWKVLVDRLDFPPMTLEERAAAIAAELRKGQPSKRFCNMLAGMIDANGKNSTLYILRLMHNKEGRPKADHRIAYLMERLVDQDRRSIDAAVYEVQKAFGKKGHSPRTCLDALAIGREARRRERVLDAWDEKDRRKRVQKTI